MAGVSDAVGGVGSHAAGVGAGVAFADALVVLRGGDLDGVGAVAEGEEGELFAGEELFEDDLGLLGAEQSAGEHLGGCLFGFEVGVADDDALACGEAVGFDDDGDGEAAELFADLFERGAEGVGRSGDVVALHEFFGEGLAGLELRGVLGGAEDAVAAFWSSSTMPRESGSSGPTTVRAGCSMATTSSIAWRLPASTGMQRASWAMPPLPGAQRTSVTCGDLRSAQTSACSRPPPPITRTFIR